MNSHRIFLTASLIIVSSRVALSQSFDEAYEVLNVNNIETGFSTSGAFFWNGVNGDYRVPKTDSVGTIFSGGLWMGGIDAGGQLKLAAQTYRQSGDDFWPGPIDELTGSTDSVTMENWDKIWKVGKAQIDQHTADFVDNGIINFPQPAIFEWPAKGNIYAKGKGGIPLTITQAAAPFFDGNGNAIYEPQLGDYPDIKGDEMLWYVFNDKGGVHTETGAQAIGAEIQISAYGFNCPADDVLYNTLFINYKIKYRGTTPLNDIYIGKWVDFDLGCFTSDYVGCDTISNTFYAYNGTPTDPDCATQGYGNNPPVQTVTFIDVPLSSFHYYNNDFTVTGNPETAVHYYNYLSGYWKDNTHVTYGDDAYGGIIPTTFLFPGNPADTTEWSECSESNTPADRRGIGAIGPLNFTPGQTVDMTLAFTTHFLTFNGCPDFTPYRQRIDSLQNLFDNDLLLPCTQSNLTCDDSIFTCVWPGDADDNGIANINDILPIGIGYGDSAAPRPNASANWIGQPMQDWSQNFTLIGTNYKHADCDGNGVIDSFDLQPIISNYGLVHFKESGGQKIGIPLYAEVQPGPFTAGSTVSVDVFLGTQTLQIPDFYAVAFSLFYNSAVVQPGSVTVDYSISWAGTKGIDMLALHKELSTAGEVDVGITRIDHANRAGFGRIARINYILIDDIAGKDEMQLPTLGPWVAEAKAIRNDETEIELDIISGGIPSLSDIESLVRIYPNPAENLLHVEFPSSFKPEFLKLFDSIGKEIFSTNSVEQKISISTENFPRGIYFLEISGEQGRMVYKVSVVK